MSEEAPWSALEGTKLESVRVDGVDLRPGDPVKLCPTGRSSDIMDLALVGKSGIIESIEQSFDEEVYLAIVLDDDPGRDLGYARQPGHRFFFRPSEVEPIRAGGRP